MLLASSSRRKSRKCRLKASRNSPWRPASPSTSDSRPIRTGSRPPTRRIRRSSPKGACQALRANGCADLIAPGGVAPGIQMVYLLSLSGSEMAGLLRKQAHALAGKLGNLLVIVSP